MGNYLIGVLDKSMPNPGDGSKLRPPSRTFQDLTVWKRAHVFTLDIYRFMRAFPREETCGLTSQLRRAAVSTPENIAEGFRKQSKADKARFLNIAEGSLEECKYYLILAHDLRYGDTTELWNASEEVGRLLNAYRKAILNSTN